VRGARATAVEHGHSLAEDIFLTSLSLVVVMVVIGLIFMPPAPSMAVDIQADAIASNTIVVYGKVVDTQGLAVRGATVVVAKQTATGYQQVASLVAAADGTFRTEIRNVAGTYRVVVTADVGRRTVSDTLTYAMAPGHAYATKAELQPTEYFLFLPITSY